MSYAFGTLLYYQAKNAISPEYEHQHKNIEPNKNVDTKKENRLISN